MNNHTKSFLFTEEDKRLYELPQVFSISSVWLEDGMNKYWATFDLVVRELPPHRNFMVFSGLEEMIHDILNWKYTDEEIKYLKHYKIITDSLVKYLKNFKFSGDLYAMPEGSVFFPKEPVVRISAPLLEGNLLTMMLMNILTSNTIFSTKAARCVIAAKPKTLIGPWGMRAHSWESAMKCARADYMVGSTVGAPSFFRKYNISGKKITTALIGYHAFIKSYDDELTAMMKLANYGGKFLNTSVMVDTYDLIPGIKNAIIMAKAMEKKNKKLTSITIDSGDLYKNAVIARKMLDKAGLKYVKITLASNLDEYKIKEMMDKHVPADAFIMATEGLTVADAPKLETVYKISQLVSKTETKYMAKLTPGKESYPGLKNVYREYSSTGSFKSDTIGLEEEKGLGSPLLKPYILKGKLVKKLPSLDALSNYCQKEISRLPKKYLAIEQEYLFPVKVSHGLNKLNNIVRSQHLRTK